MNNFFRYFFDGNYNGGGNGLEVLEKSNGQGEDQHELEASNDIEGESKDPLKIQERESCCIINENGPVSGSGDSCKECGCTCSRSICSSCRIGKESCGERERSRRRNRRKRCSSQSRSKSRANGRKEPKISVCRSRRRRRSQCILAERESANPCKRRRRTKSPKEPSNEESQSKEEEKEKVKEETEKQPEMSEKEVQTEKEELPEKEVQTENQTPEEQPNKTPTSCISPYNPCSRKGSCASYATPSFIWELRKSSLPSKRRKPRCNERRSGTHFTKRSSRQKRCGRSRSRSRIRRKKRSIEESIRSQFVDSQKGILLKSIGDMDVCCRGLNVVSRFDIRSDGPSRVFSRRKKNEKTALRKNAIRDKSCKRSRSRRR